jgi:hypothetical protein
MTAATIILTVVGYVILAFLHLGLFMADFLHDYPPERGIITYRSHLAVSAFFALIPVYWIIGPFLTGFYQHGWRLK